MADEMSDPTTRCPWCSAALPAPDVERCPSCGAAQSSATGTEPLLPGVTTLDTEAIIRARSEVSRPRSRILSFITGDMQESGEPIDETSIAPPSAEVRREMLRLQIEAERADLEAESLALKSDVVVERGIQLSDLAEGTDASPDPAHVAVATGQAAVESLPAAPAANPAGPRPDGDRPPAGEPEAPAKPIPDSPPAPGA